MDLHLVHAVQHVFHRVFDRNDVRFLPVQVLQCRIQGCRFPAPRGSGQQDHAVLLLDHAPEQA
ncbi:hypothetical protein D3C76_1697530 [compost metagenome]